MLNPDVKIIGVEPSDAASMKAALGAGQVVELEAISTIADGVAVKAVGDKLLPTIEDHVDDIILVDDEELIGAFLDVMENHKMIVENAGLLSVAALKQLEERLKAQPDSADKKVVCVLSGGNMDVITMASVVQHGLIQRDRIFTVSVLLPDKPGELVRVAKTVSDAQGNIVKLDHNQFYSTNRNKAVELRITMEAFGSKHKQDILTSLEDAGFKPKLVTPQL
jgi:threonine dehydratase